MGACVEVEEPLVPDLLLHVGPALLSGMKVRTRIITMPNQDYNATLHALGPTLLPHERGNSDDSFGW